MMNFRLVEITARLIASVSRDFGRPPPPPARERDLGISALQLALRARGRRHRRRTILVVAATATAIAAGLTLMVSLRGAGIDRHGAFASFGKSHNKQDAPAQSIRAWGIHLMELPEAAGETWAQASVDDRRGLDLPDGDPVHVGQSMDARGPDGARLALSGGTTLHLTPQARIDVKSLGDIQKFGLQSGRLHADVAPLDAGQRFLIQTPDGEIEVHGTVFELAVVPPQPGCAVGTTTRVTVSRGVVEVRAAGRDDFVRAGQHWPPECDAMIAPGRAAAPADEARAPNPPAPASISTTTARPVLHARARARAHRAAADSPSELAAQNDLFASAMAAKGHGQMRRALDSLDHLIGRFPRGQLAEAAHAERMRLQGRAGDQPAARKEAREYLEAFPDGFAASEARLVLGPGREAP